MPIPTLPTPDLETPRGRRAAHLIRVVLALAAGAGAALAHPPFGFMPGLLGYPLLMLLTEGSRTPRGGFWMGWLAGFAYFFISCWWVAEAFLVNAEQAWMAPFAASLLPIGLGLFWGGATAVYRRLAMTGAGRALVFAALFCLFEWLRGHVLTGFPWNPAGAAWRAGGAGSQFASVVGIYGLSFVTVAGASLPAPLLDGGARRPRLLAAAAGAALLAALPIGGAARLAGADLRFTDTVVRIVQADIAQESKWSPEAYAGIVRRYLALTTRPGPVRPDIVVWPEGALPAVANDVFAPGAADGAAIARAIQPGQTLILGLGRAEADAGVRDGRDAGLRYFNSAFVLTDEGDAGLRVSAVYDKHRLVPFGEYLPAGGLLGALGVRSLTHMPLDFTAGPRPAPIRAPGLPPVQPLICYESLYPGFTPGGADRPGWIVNISNDAWFGRTSGPVQHLNLASYRAIETGLPIVRSTPTGVSALIDPWGRVVGGHRLEPGVSGVIDARLPEAGPATVYGRVGDLPFALMVILGLSLSPWRSAIRTWRDRRRQAEPAGAGTGFARRAHDARRRST